VTQEKNKEKDLPTPVLIRDEQNNAQISFTAEDVNRWIKLGLIPPDLAANFLNSLEQSHLTNKNFKEFKEKFPNASQQEIMKEVFGIPKVLTTEESEKFLSNAKQSVDFHNFLVGNWEKLEKDTVPETPLFKNIDQSTEFGIVRFIADQMNHLPNLLDNSKIEQIAANEYLIRSTKELREEGVKTLVFSYPITAQNEEEAYETAEKMKEKLLGIRHKMWEACWLYANYVNKIQFTVSINELMKSCYPNREAKFSAKDKEGFYEELRLLRLAEFTLIKTVTNKNNTTTTYKYNIPLLRVGGSLTEGAVSSGPPDKIFIDLCAITPMPSKSEKMIHVAAPIKKSSLELKAQDCTLAFFLQVRKNQIYIGKKDIDPPHFDFDMSQLIEAAVLQKTFNSNPTMGIKRLQEKLERAKDKGIIKNHKKIPSKSRTIIRIWW